MNYFDLIRGWTYVPTIGRRGIQRADLKLILVTISLALA